jgi:acyl carrier protein
VTHEEIEGAVIRIVADALDHEPSKVLASSSLIDDLGAESIDFLDIQFRIESQFGIKVPGEEIWAGSFGSRNPDPPAIAEGVKELRRRMPQFHWDRIPNPPTKGDLPRLITVSTIVDYLDRRLAVAGA